MTMRDKVGAQSGGGRRQTEGRWDCVFEYFNKSKLVLIEIKVFQFVLKNKSLKTRSRFSQFHLQSVSLHHFTLPH